MCSLSIVTSSSTLVKWMYELLATFPTRSFYESKEGDATLARAGASTTLIDPDVDSVREVTRANSERHKAEAPDTQERSCRVISPAPEIVLL